MSHPPVIPTIHVLLLTRAGCSLCERVYQRLAELAAELEFDLACVDVDTAAASGNSDLRAEFGDRLPVVLLDGQEHSYWDIDEPRLRADVMNRRSGRFGAIAENDYRG